MASQSDSALEIYGAPMLDQSFGVSVVLRRGDSDSAAFTATWSKQEYRIEDEAGIGNSIESRDYVFKASLAVVDGVTIEPRDGDQIVEGSAIYELMKMGERKAAELLPGGYRYLVHTKRVA